MTDEDDIAMYEKILQSVLDDAQDLSTCNVDWVAEKAKQIVAAVGTVKPTPIDADLGDAFMTNAIGAKLTCSEINDLCAILCYSDRHYESMCLMASHIDVEEPGMEHYEARYDKRVAKLTDILGGD